MTKVNEVEEKIYTTFSSVVRSIGYNEVHARILSALLVAGRQLSLQELSKKTGYSLASLSLSLDLLELLGIIAKTKNKGDRKLYVRLSGDLIEGLRKALLLKIQKEIMGTFSEFDKYRKVKNRNTRKVISVLEKEIKRLDEYVKNLAAIEVPDK